MQNYTLPKIVICHVSTEPIHRGKVVDIMIPLLRCPNPEGSGQAPAIGAGNDLMTNDVLRLSA